MPISWCRADNAPPDAHADMSTLRSNVQSPQWDVLQIRRVKVGHEAVCGARLQAVTRLNSPTVPAASVATPWSNSTSCSPLYFRLWQTNTWRSTKARLKLGEFFFTLICVVALHHPPSGVSGSFLHRVQRSDATRCCCCCCCCCCIVFIRFSMCFIFNKHLFYLTNLQLHSEDYKL